MTANLTTAHGSNNKTMVDTNKEHIRIDEDEPLINEDQVRIEEKRMREFEKRNGVEWMVWKDRRIPNPYFTF